MSRIAELRESLASYVGGDGFGRTVTRREWAEFVREYKLPCVQERTHLSVRELREVEQYSDIPWHSELAWLSDTEDDYIC
jgi:hypothetical protein